MRIEVCSKGMENTKNEKNRKICKYPWKNILHKVYNPGEENRLMYFFIL